MEREVGGGIGMGNTCKPMAVSFQCMTKFTTNKKKKKEKPEEPEIKLPISAGSSKKQETVPEKKIYFCFIDYAKAFDCVDHNKLWKILKEMGIPDSLICLLRNL